MENSKRIFLIRHGESSHNRNGNLLSGITDVKLSNHGVEQCMQLRKLVKHFSIDKVYSSPLKRAIKSANLVFPDKHVMILEHLREINYGVYEGLRGKDDSTDEVLNKWESSPGNLTFPEGDNVHNFSQAYYHNLLDVVAGSEDKFFAFFTHRTAIRLFIATVLGLDLNLFRKIPCSNCSLSELYYNKESGFQLSAVNLNLIKFM